MSECRYFLYLNTSMVYTDQFIRMWLSLLQNFAESFVTHLKIVIITTISGYNFQRGGNGGVGPGSTNTT